MWAEFKKRPVDRSLENTFAYAQVVKEIGEKLKVPVLDLWSLFPSPDSGLNKYFVDGLHFSAIANQCVGEAVVRKICEEWPEDLHPTRMKQPFVEWQEINLESQTTVDQSVYCNGTSP